jgi:hypothetical protein
LTDDDDLSAGDKALATALGEKLWQGGKEGAETFVMLFDQHAAGHTEQETKEYFEQLWTMVKANVQQSMMPHLPMRILKILTEAAARREEVRKIGEELSQGGKAMESAVRKMVEVNKELYRAGGEPAIEEFFNSMKFAATHGGAAARNEFVTLCGMYLPNATLDEIGRRIK